MNEKPKHFTLQGTSQRISTIFGKMYCYMRFQFFQSTIIFFHLSRRIPIPD